MSSLTDPPPHPSSGPPLRPGAHLLPARSGTRWLLAEPGERFTRVQGPPEVLRRLQPELHGAPLDDDPALAEARVGLRQLLGAAGALQEVAPREAAAPRVALWGAGPVAAQVLQLLAPRIPAADQPAPDPVSEGMARTPPPLSVPDGARGRVVALQQDLSGTVPDCDVLITCAGWLPDQRFGELDEECHRRGVGWHRCHVEGTAVAVGPLQTPGGVRYRDWRGRRLAASTTPEELLDLWAHLDAPGASLPPVPSPSVPVAAVAAALLLDDVEQWWSTPGPAGQHPREHVLETLPGHGLRIDEHLVLPLP